MRKSGGLALAIHKNITKYLTYIETDLVLWFKIDKHLVKTDSDILFSVTLVPPECSDYADNDPFLSIQVELNEYLRTYNHVCLLATSILEQKKLTII